jgi:protein TonB
LQACLALPLAGLLAADAIAQSQAEIETALELYRYRLLQSGTRLRAYPPEALEQELEGTVSAELIIAGDGTLRSVTLLSSSGHAVLDQGALDLLARAVPLTEIPSTLQNKAFAIRIAIVFKLPVAPSA